MSTGLEYISVPIEVMQRLLNAYSLLENFIALRRETLRGNASTNKEEYLIFLNSIDNIIDRFQSDKDFYSQLKRFELRLRSKTLQLKQYKQLIKSGCTAKELTEFLADVYKIDSLDQFLYQRQTATKLETVLNERLESDLQDYEDSQLRGVPTREFLNYRKSA